MKQPNIVFLFSDQQRWDTCGCYGQPLPTTPNLFLQISESHCGRAIRTNRWKYSVRAPDKTGADPSSEVYVEDFLYDLREDPHERNNLVSDPGLKDVRAKLAEIIKRRMREIGEAEPEILPA